MRGSAQIHTYGVAILRIVRVTGIGETMQQQLTQSEVEWLRCLPISRKLTPILPEQVRLKLENAQLIEGKPGNAAVTESGASLLRQR